eukprot:g18072.t1
MGQLLLLLVARSAAKPWDQAIKAAVDEEVEDAPWNVGEQRDCKGDKCWEKSDMSSDQRSTSLSAEVAALVHAAKVNQAIENVQEASKEGLDQTQAQNKREAPKEASSSEFDQSALRSSHREVEGLPEGLQRWQIYLRQAAQRLRSLEMMEVTKASKAVASAASNESHESQAAASSEFERPRAVDPVEEYHMLYEAVNQVIAGLQLAVASAATPEVFAEVASLLVTLAEQSRGTAFEHEDFWSQALAAVALGCRMSRGFGEPQDQDWMCDVVQQQNWLETHENRSGKGTLGGGKTQLHKVWNSVRNATAFLRSSELRSHMQTWRRYWEQGATAPKALWRSTVGSPHRDSFNPSDDLENSNTASDGLPKKKMWQVFPTFIMAKEIELSQPSGRSQPGSGCEPCGDGAKSTSKSTPTVFADPRGTTPFRYASGVGGRLEPTAPFHRLAYFDAKTGLSLIFPSWLVHGVAPHHGVRHRVVFAYNLHTSPGEKEAKAAQAPKTFQLPEPDRQLQVSVPPVLPPELEEDEGKLQLQHITLLSHPVRISAIDNFFTEEECHGWITWGEKHAALRKQNSTYAHRNNGRIEFFCMDTAYQIWLRMKGFVPETVGGRRALGCSPRIRVYRYVKGQRFGQHVDGSRDEPELGWFT